MALVSTTATRLLARGTTSKPCFSCKHLPWRQTLFQSIATNADKDDVPAQVWILGAGSIGLLRAAAILSRHDRSPLWLLLRDHHADNLIFSHTAHAKGGRQLASINISVEQPSLLLWVVRYQFLFQSSSSSTWRMNHLRLS
jgi:hypothetical protein